VGDGLTQIGQSLCIKRVVLIERIGHKLELTRIHDENLVPHLRQILSKPTRVRTGLQDDSATLNALKALPNMMATIAELGGLDDPTRRIHFAEVNELLTHIESYGHSWCRFLHGGWSPFRLQP